MIADAVPKMANSVEGSGYSTGSVRAARIPKNSEARVIGSRRAFARRDRAWPDDPWASARSAACIATPIPVGADAEFKTGRRCGACPTFVPHAHLVHRRSCGSVSIRLPPSHTTRYAGVGPQVLEEAGVRDLVEFYDQESQIVFPRLLADGREWGIGTRRRVGYDGGLVNSIHRDSGCARLGWCGELSLLESIQRGGRAPVANAWCQQE